MTDAPEPTARALLARRDLRLVPIVEGDLDATLRWVHSSDLVDPTPFLSEGLALLTTGTQFAVDDSGDAYDSYVARLVARGVVALGFGTEVVREGVPPLLTAAAREHRMTLFEVPYRTPFIAVARANAEAVAARAYARRSWSLAAQRAISLAALRADGLHATVVELARQLDAWVGLYDAGGALGHESAPRESADRAGVDDRVAAVLHRRHGAAASYDIAAGQVVLQTLGRGEHLRGVLAVAGPRLDAEARSVVTTVAAMAGLALEQSSAVRRARGELRTAVLRALAEGDRALAARVAVGIGGLPEGEVRVGVVDDADAPRDALAEWLEARGDGAFFGRLDEDLVLLVPDDRVAADLATEFAVPVGLSVTADLDRPGGFDGALRQARVAARGRGAGVRRFEASDVLSAASPDEARVQAAALLAPLVAHDAAHAADLVGTLRVWLEEDGGNEATARRLGVHRHTVRARVALAQRVLARDLAGFPARAELWAALRLSA